MKAPSKFLILALFSICQYSWANAPTHYNIVIDAGSSGSKLHVFEIQSNSDIPAIKDIFSESVKPGLSSFADHPAAAGESLKKLLDDATEQLQKNGIDLKTVSIDILATAGMRLLPETTQQDIYEQVKNYIHTYYSFSIGDITTISGKMEGVYGWLDVNYLAGNFQHHRPTLGTLDMGGASTQIVFATYPSTKPNDELVVKMGDQSYLVFSKSFLGLGLDQALNAVLQDKTASACFATHYPVSQKEMGNFNLSACHQAYKKVIQSKQVIEQLPAIPATQQFLGYSGIYYNYQFFATEQTPDQVFLEARINQECSKSWEELQKDYPTIPSKYLANYCANGAYIDALLFSTYELKPAQLTVADKVQQQAIDWTLGAVLYKLTQSH